MGVWAAGLGRRPGALAGLERQHERHPGATQRLDKPGVVAVEAIGHHRPKRDLGLLGGLDELGGQPGLGPKPRVALAFRQPGRRRVGHRMQRPVAARVRPQAGHRHDAVVGLADRPQVLAGHVRGVAAVFAVAGVVDHQHPLGVWRGGRVLAQQLDPLLVDGLVVPGRLRQKPLQPLDLAVLGTGDRLGVGQGGQGLVAVAWQQQALQVVAQAAALRQACEQGVEPSRVGLQRAGCGWAGAAGGHRQVSSWRRAGS